MADQNLWDFLQESLQIEGILRPPLLPEVEAAEKFLALPALTVGDVSALVLAFQRDGALRSRRGMNVRVGSHVPPAGGPSVVKTLENILTVAPATDPWITHVDFESLHPYLDGNGRAGRLIWLWQWKKLGRAIPKSFLHQFYYQSLNMGGRLLKVRK
jgi:hypothetical protein